MGAGGWFGGAPGLQRAKRGSKESGSEQRGELASCLCYFTLFPLSCHFPPDSPHLQHFLSLDLPVPALLCFLLSAVIPTGNCTLQLSYLSSSLPGNPRCWVPLGCSLAGEAQLMLCPIFLEMQGVGEGGWGWGHSSWGRFSPPLCCSPTHCFLPLTSGALSGNILVVKTKKQSRHCPLLGLCLTDCSLVTYDLLLGHEIFV